MMKIKNQVLGIGSKKHRKSFDGIICPIHRYPVKVKVMGGRFVGVCRCNVPDNQYYDSVVWDQQKTKE